MPTTTNSELIAILRSRKTPGALTKMNRKQLEALVESTGGTPRPSAPASAALLNHCRENDELKKLLDQERTEVAGHIMKRMLMATEIDNLKEENEKLKEELELSRAFNERFRQGHEMCEVYKGRCIGIEMENKELKGRVDIMEKCKKAWYDKCQEDPDDDPDRSGLKWSICLEGGLNYFMKEAIRYEESYDEIKAEKVNLIETIGELREYIELGEDKNQIDVFNKIFEGA